MRTQNNNRCGPFSMALTLLHRAAKAGTRGAGVGVSVDGLITHRFTLDQANEALDAAASKDSLKVAIRIAQS
jgi:hypothetical protein